MIPYIQIINDSSCILFSADMPETGFSNCEKMHGNGYLHCSEMRDGRNMKSEKTRKNDEGKGLEVYKHAVEL